VLIFCIAGLLFIVLRARRTLGAYRIPRRPVFSSHLVNEEIGKVEASTYVSGCGTDCCPPSNIKGKEAALACFRPASDRFPLVHRFWPCTDSDRCSALVRLRHIPVSPWKKNRTHVDGICLNFAKSTLMPLINGTTIMPLAWLSLKFSVESTTHGREPWRSTPSR